MKRLIFAAFAIFALAGTSFAEPEPGETVTTPPGGTIYPPATPENPNPNPIDVIIGDDGQLHTPGGGDVEIPGGDNSFETAIQAMYAALRGWDLAQGAWNYADSAMGQANAAMRQANAAMEEAKKKGKIELGTGYAEVMGDISFDKGSATLTVPGKKVRLEKSSREGTLDIVAATGQNRTATFGKLAGKDAISEADDYADSVTAKDQKVTEDLTNLILSYHPPEEGVPDEATNVLAKVAFDGDYNSLTNTPTFSFEEEEVAEGEGGEGGTKLVLVVSSGTAVVSNDVGLAKVAKTGSWADIVGAPDGAVFSGGQVQMEGDALQARPIYVGIDTNGLYGATNDWQEICRITPREWFTGSADVLEDVSASGDSVTFSFCTLKLSPTNGLERVASEKQSVTITLPTNGCDCAGGSVTNVYVCECNGGEGCGCGGGGGDDEEGNCSCQIKTAQDVNDVEKDPEWSKWKSDDFDGWKADIDKDVADACAAITAICEHIGYVPSVWQSRADAGGGGQGSAEDMP